MKAMLYLKDNENPVAVLDEVQVVQLDDNHKVSPARITYKSKKMNAWKTMIELHRDEKMAVTLEDGRHGSVIWSMPASTWKATPWACCASWAIGIIERGGGKSEVGSQRSDIRIPTSDL